jgi:succinate dehydrogenase / fumarate reductase, flavoprotein subunit
VTAPVAASERCRVRRVIVVGAGVAGLMTTLRLCEARVPVLLVSLRPARGASAALTQGGLNAALGADDSPRRHLEETLVAGDFLAHQPPVWAMVEAAPAITSLLDRIGVPWDRTPEGRVDLRRASGSRCHRTAVAGDATTPQILHALDGQVRRLETLDVTDGRGATVFGEKLVRRLEHWEFLDLVRDDHGVTIGIVAQNLWTMKIDAFPADAVCLATGGPQAIFGRSTAGLDATGAAAAAVFEQGAVYANGEFVELHPTAVAGPDKLHLVSERVRAEGGRLFVATDPDSERRPGELPESDRDYFLERMYPELGNLVTSDLAARAVLEVAGAQPVYLDVRHLDRGQLARRLGGVLDLYQQVTGEDPTLHPMRVSPAVHYGLGGLWVDYEADADGTLQWGSPRNHATNLPGLYAVGEVDYQYHGAGCLGGNSLLGCLFGGMLAGAALAAYRGTLARSAFELPASLFEKARSREGERFERVLEQATAPGDGENPFLLRAELGEAMRRRATVPRHDDELRELLIELDDLTERAGRSRIADRGLIANQSARCVRQLGHMLRLARVIVAGAIRRQECRGAHWKPDRAADAPGAPRATLARHGATGEVEFTSQFDYECAGARVHVTDAIDTRLVAPRPRDYGRREAGDG